SAFCPPGLERFPDGWRTVLASRERERPEGLLRSLTLPARLGAIRLRTALSRKRLPCRWPLPPPRHSLTLVAAPFAGVRHAGPPSRRTSPLHPSDPPCARPAPLLPRGPAARGGALRL